MTSLFGRMVGLFPGVVRHEDLFTEAVARLFERRPDICLGWLEELGAISASADDRQPHVRVFTQKTFVAMEDHKTDSRPDLIVETSHAPEDDDAEPHTEVVMFESKIGAIEGESQLRRYAAHLGAMAANRKTLIYMTRAYDPKDEADILAETTNVTFRQLRWHDFYKFLQRSEKDALVEEVMLFMEEQRMAQSHCLSTTDLMALSGVPRAFEIFDETLNDEVVAKLKSFAGNRVIHESARIRREIRSHRRYLILAQLHGHDDLICGVGYRMPLSIEYPVARIILQTKPGAEGKEISVTAMKGIALRENWEGHDLDDPSRWAGVRCEKSLADFLHEEDHIAAIKQFFIESIRELREELTEFKKENPDLPWNGGN